MTEALPSSSVAPLSEEQRQELRKARYNATLSMVREVHEDLRVIRVRPDTKPMEHKPGQFVTLGLGLWEPREPGCGGEAPITDATRLIRRAYSISSSMCDEEGTLTAPPDEELELFIVLVRSREDGKGGLLTPRLFARKEGDRLELGAKITGHYVLPPDIDPMATILFLSTGTGEAPHNYMSWELLRRGHTGAIRNVTCVRVWKDLGYRAEHERMMAKYPNYRYVPFATRETGVEKCYLQDLVASKAMDERLDVTLDPANTHVFLCGNPSMIGIPERDRETRQRKYPAKFGTVEALEKRGFQADDAIDKIKGNVHFEKYW